MDPSQVYISFKTTEQMSASLSGDLTMVAWLSGHKRTYTCYLIDTDTTNNVLGSSLELRARWTVFTTPLAHVTQLQEVTAGPLKDCLLCVSEDGTVAVIVIDGFQL
jgi:hypothetical protein